MLKPAHGIRNRSMLLLMPFSAFLGNGIQDRWVRRSDIDTCWAGMRRATG